VRPSRVKAKLNAGQPVLVTTLHLTDPSIHELAGLMGFDGIWMDMEHHTYNLETAATLMRALRVGSGDVIARPAKGEFMRMQRMLEAGAHGIMYPRCDNPEEAREVVGWMKFAPQGRRGCDGANPDMPYLFGSLADYLEAANRETFLVLQIETPEALECVDELAAIDGVDILMLGPADYSILTGVPGQFDHASIHRAKRQIADAAQAAGKHWGCPVPSVDAAREMLDMGARILFYQGDIVMIKQGLEKVQHDMGALGLTFNNHFG
jgi:4-hydroxy-2-oxoheptanedioate aldolase